MKIKRNRTFLLWFDRALSHSLQRQLMILGIILVIALGLSYLFLYASNAEWEQFCEKKDLNKWLLPLYLLIDSNALNNLYIGDVVDGRKAVHGWMLIASSMTFLFGAFVFNGVIIGVITNSIEQRVNSHKEGRIPYLKSGHYIIMGYDDMVSSFVTHIFDKDNEAYVSIFSSMESSKIREKLRTSFSEEKMMHIIVNYGHKTSTESYKDIFLEAAECVYIVGDHHKPAHDAINVECVDSICRYLNNPKIKGTPRKIVCMFKDLDTYAAFKTSEIFRKVDDLDIEFVPYNFYAGWAKQVFVKRQYNDFDNLGVVYNYPAVYGNGITPADEKHVHLVFVGTTNFAVAFAMEAAHVLHFPNYCHNHNLKTKITFIDINADKEKDEFIIRNRHYFEIQPYLYQDLSNESNDVTPMICKEYVCFGENDANFLDVEFEFIKGDVFSQRVQAEISKWSNSKEYLTIFLALADQRQNFVIGMNMPDAVYDNEVPVFIRQDRSDNFVTNLRNADKKVKDEDKLTYSIVTKNGTLDQRKCEARYANIYPFGMNETAYCEDYYSLKRAKLINYLYTTANYDTYKFQDISVLDEMPSEQIWEKADGYWKELSVALRWSNLYSAYTIRTKQATLRAMRGLKIDDTSLDYQPLSDYEADELAVVEHNRWNIEKLLMGYRKPKQEEDKYLHVEFADKLKKNKNLFIHHDIRPFEELDVIKELDKEFSRYIPWILKMTETCEK